ncbi:AbrB/MazE/SpoVT family DNA-binding domain-containing protein [Alteromonas antoniana]|uniref:AbrB/MazE/SpoVT family DNA-binding domain-containing protein n=1 Tax=Alteromonas antoniana TaxID=2803813 RepID=UPI001C4395EC|nr:AbrB/MazE/SpoVT family DNA-binding domain-containing protein [Alteromonas antoniana]
METVIRKYGNSKGVIIPAALLKELNLDVNEKIDVKVENGRIIIAPVRKPEYPLEELLAQCSQKAMILSDEDKTWLTDSPANKEAP